MNTIAQTKIECKGSINISELKGNTIKKELGAKRCMFRWHNKNNSGGNFGINIIGINGKNYELSGFYDHHGNVCNLRFGYIYEAGSMLPRLNLQETLKFLNKVLKGINETLSHT